MQNYILYPFALSFLEPAISTIYIMYKHNPYMPNAGQQAQFTTQEDVTM